MDPELEKMLEPLRFHSARLDVISKPNSSPTLFYEAMSGGLAWSDEIPRDAPVEVIWGLRPLGAYRSSLIIGEPQEKWRSYWEECVALFPHWIGFRPERSRSSPEVLSVLKRGQKQLKRCLERTDEKTA